MNAAATSTTTREDLLTAAADLLQRVGYASFSYRDLGKVVGIRSASIHYHFPSKADLGVALVEHFRKQGANHWDQLEQDHPDIRQRLRAVAEIMAANTCQAGKSCPLNSLQAEFSVLPKPMQRAVNRAVSDCLERLANWLEDGRKRKQLNFPGKAIAQARLVWSVYEYGSQLACANPDQPFIPLAEQLLATMAVSAVSAAPAMSRKAASKRG